MRRMRSAPKSLRIALPPRGSGSPVRTPHHSPRSSTFFSMGVNVLNVKCRDYIKKNESIGLPDLMMRMKQEGEDIYCYPSDCYWLDIGRVDDYQVAQEEFEHNKGQFLPDEQ